MRSSIHYPQYSPGTTGLRHCLYSTNNSERYSSIGTEEVFKDSFKEEDNCRLFLAIGAEARPFRIFTYLAVEADGFWEDEKLMEDACLLLAYIQLPRDSNGEPFGLS